MKNKPYILLVDDDGTDHILDLFEVFNLDIHQAEDGEEALAILKKEEGQCFLLMTDYQMPNMSGRTLIKEVFKSKIPVKNLILSTSYSKHEIDFDSIKEEISRSHKLEFFQKGYQLDELEGFLKKIS